MSNLPAILTPQSELNKLTISRSLRRLIFLRANGVRGFIHLNEQLFLWHMRYAKLPDCAKRYHAVRKAALVRRGLLP